MRKAYGKNVVSNDPHAMMRAQMDEMMGKNRDVPLDQRKASDAAGPDFADPNIDKFYLCGCSPWELLKGTKSEQLPQLSREGFLLDRSEMLKIRRAVPCAELQSNNQAPHTHGRWESLPQAERDSFGFEHDLLVFLQELTDVPL